MNTIVKPQTMVHIRWMIRRDMPEVLALENASFEFPWAEEDFVRMLRQRNNIGMVAEHGGEVVGYMIYGLFPGKLHVYNLAACPAKKGIGRALINKLIGKLCPSRRNKIVCEVRETNLDACLFFRALGFKAVETLRDFYEDTSEDAYQFRYRITAND
jgi:[ribosomal protein S18]-alanine N-acetyltransferase